MQNLVAYGLIALSAVGFAFGLWPAMIYLGDFFNDQLEHRMPEISLALSVLIIASSHLVYRFARKLSKKKETDLLVMGIVFIFISAYRILFNVAHSLKGVNTVIVGNEILRFRFHVESMHAGLVLALGCVTILVFFLRKLHFAFAWKNNERSHPR